MYEDFFLTYANVPLRENPKYLRHLVSEIAFPDDDFVQKDVEHFLDVSDSIINILDDDQVSEQKNSNPSIKHFSTNELIRISKTVDYLDRKRLKTILNNEYGWVGEESLAYNLNVYDIAYQSIFGCKLGGCIIEIQKDRIKILGKSEFSGKKFVKCFECDQAYFRYILSELISGKEYRSIDWFDYYLGVKNETIRIINTVHIGKPRNHQDDSSNTALIKEDYVEVPLSFHKDTEGINIYLDLNPFRESLISVAIYSLTEFLINDDRRKLKHCEWCNKFFLAKRNDSRIKYCDSCSPKSKMTKEQRKVYQREYRKTKRRYRSNKTKNEIVKKYLKAGYSEKEAEELFEFDSSL